jgi:hypothetical protein
MVVKNENDLFDHFNEIIQLFRAPFLFFYKIYVMDKVFVVNSTKNYNQL